MPDFEIFHSIQTNIFEFHQKSEAILELWWIFCKITSQLVVVSSMHRFSGKLEQLLYEFRLEQHTACIVESHLSAYQVSGNSDRWQSREPTPYSPTQNLTDNKTGKSCNKKLIYERKAGQNQRNGSTLNSTAPQGKVSPNEVMTSGWRAPICPRRTPFGPMIFAQRPGNNITSMKNIMASRWNNYFQGLFRHNLRFQRHLVEKSCHFFVLQVDSNLRIDFRSGHSHLTIGEQWVELLDSSLFINNLDLFNREWLGTILREKSNNCVEDNKSLLLVCCCCLNEDVLRLQNVLVEFVLKIDERCVTVGVERDIAKHGSHDKWSDLRGLFLYDDLLKTGLWRLGKLVVGRWDFLLENANGTSQSLHTQQIITIRWNINLVDFLVV
ncbi:hypothetical protein GCK72_004977 [Caenorhabditis remanei]|uniref:Uncharacterized protein n=1 Tax=Caenorhabditis remanei TaxID=31234 RepID=A0A6A5HDY7_CAERE|nr:hypothetical protein GCK72_004977 [Caenorhabditis remanei]KAF1765026.1 hypothetical protein GCK72_004977 [Caenorhabditis remanei]